MADITALINYYKNLLIIQYNNQPKAQATIQLFAQVLLANGIALDVENAYDIDTAVGVQLDVIGKYQGVNRYFSEIELNDYFSLVTYSETGSLPSSPPRFGFSTQAHFSDYNYNGTLIYPDIITTQNGLSDDNFRILVKLAILLNNMNYSPGAADAGLWALFGSQIRRESSFNMSIQYFLEGAETTLIQAIIAKHLLPRPMGVALSIVTGITGNMFAFTDYSGYESPYGHGFSDYSNYAATPGQVLTYSMITEG